MERLIELASPVVVAWMWVAAFRSYRDLPDTIPIHFNFWGRPDGWGPRWMIFLLPVLALFLLFLWSAIGIGVDSVVSPKGGRPGHQPLQRQQKEPFHLLLLVMVAGFSYLNQKMVEIAGGRAAALSRSFLPIFLLAIGGVILWMVRAGSR
ncbi:MAG: DUF1648 domain-containing protein [Blastocatellia bacterium]